MKAAPKAAVRYFSGSDPSAFHNDLKPHAEMATVVIKGDEGSQLHLVARSVSSPAGAVHVLNQAGLRARFRTHLVKRNGNLLPRVSALVSLTMR